MIQAYKTNIGATKQAYAMINAKSIKFVGFQVGTGGCRDGQVLTVNRNTTILPNLVDEFGEDRITTEITSGTSIRIVCSIPSGVLASNTISNIGLLAKIVGESSTFLYAISNFSDIPSGKLTLAITLNN